MMIRKIETLENEFVEQLSQLLHNTFLHIPVKFEIKYFLGEESNGIKGLYFEITSSTVEMIYSKFLELTKFQVLSDIEEPFIQEIFNDLVLGGVTFLNVEKSKGLALKHKRENKVGTGIIYLN